MTLKNQLTRHWQQCGFVLPTVPSRQSNLTLCKGCRIPAYNARALHKWSSHSYSIESPTHTHMLLIMCKQFRSDDWDDWSYQFSRVEMKIILDIQFASQASATNSLALGPIIYWLKWFCRDQNSQGKPACLNYWGIIHLWKDCNNMLTLSYLSFAFEIV